MILRTVSHEYRPKIAIGRCAASGRPGAAAVEFAVVAPVLFLMLFGIVEISRGLMVVAILDNAARIGCRTGSLPGKKTSDVVTAVTNYMSTVGMTTESVTVEVNDVVADSNTAKDYDEITVIVSIPTKDITWVPKTHYLVSTLSAQMTMPKE